MGFFQKFFSIGSRRSKKQRKRMDAVDCNVPPMPDLQRQYEDQEATISRMLRSSSAHLADPLDVDCSQLPPLPHPINHIFSTPTGSTTSLASMSQRGTYTVKIHPRTLHSRTEFPNANPPMRQDSLTPKRPQDSLRRRSKSVPITPRDKTRLLGLRQDPSVASLLDMYDEHGCLDSKVFSNSPKTPGEELEGRAQTRRNGSTLRQLLGNPASRSSRHARNTSAAEGDISWAERVLCESENSSTSSLGIQTPNDALFPDIHFNHDHINNTFSTTHDVTINNSDSYPAISSMEVELSMVTEDLPAPNDPASNSPYENDSAMTPQRASQVFGFLISKKNQSQHLTEERPLPALPPSAKPLASRFSSYSSSAGSHESDNIPSLDDTHANTAAETELNVHETQSTIQNVYDTYSSKWPSESNWVEESAKRTRSQSTSTTTSFNTLRDGPKLHQVVVTSRSDTQPSRIPRGPRPLPHAPTHSTTLDLPTTNQSIEHDLHKPRHAFEELPLANLATASAPDLSISNDSDAFTPMPSRQAHRRTPSRSSVALSQDTTSLGKSIPDMACMAPSTAKPRKKEAKHKLPTHDKENGDHSAILYKAQLLPMTPVRSRPVFRAPHGSTPSPASSSDLSPVAQQLMADLRTQRMRARERERRNGRWGSSTSKLKF